MIGDDISEQSGEQQQEDKGAVEWTTTSFERPVQNQIKKSRYTYVNGLFKPENGPYLIETAFSKKDNATLNAVCAEIATVMKDDLEAQYCPYARTCIACIVTHNFKPQIDLLRQGNYFQYDIMGKYIFICKTTWHNNFNHKKLEKVIMEQLSSDAVSLAYVNYKHNDHMGQQI